MKIDINNVLGLHEQMLQLRTQRTAILTSNIANSDTPNYKAMDIDFMDIVKRLDAGKPIDTNADLKYRIPLQRSKDGNTVELESEQARFVRNSMEYQQSIAFLRSKINGLNKAIEGQ